MHHVLTGTPPYLTASVPMGQAFMEALAPCAAHVPSTKSVAGSWLAEVGTLAIALSMRLISLGNMR